MSMTKSLANARSAVRDRILLYLTGLGMTGVDSLELAAECLRRAEAETLKKETTEKETTTHARAMRTLGALLRERGVDTALAAAEPAAEPETKMKTGKRSFPPLNRSSMVSKRL